MWCGYQPVLSRAINHTKLWKKAILTRFDQRLQPNRFPWLNCQPKFYERKTEIKSQAIRTLFNTRRIFQDWVEEKT